MRRAHACFVAVLAALFLGGSFAQADDENKYQELTEGKTKIEGLWTLWHKDGTVLAELRPNQLDKEYIIIASIARGVSHGDVIGGMSWNFGDDAIWTFRMEGDRIFVIRRNMRFRADRNSPEAAAVELAYTDSILYSLKIEATSPSGNYLLNLTPIFMSDDQQIGQALGPRFRFMSDRSTWASVKAFDRNVELEVAAVYSGDTSIETVVDTRGVQVTVHYSISQLPAVGANGYTPRMADDRVGYFLTVLKDFSDRDDPEHFVRYINRWNLQPLNADLELSPPKEPIIFIIEKTTPVFLRPTVEAAILEWNRAFEECGLSGAVQVMHEEVAEARFNVDIQPEDVNYNFFRWITAEAGFAMGPSRVDPRTGQILDADIIFDAGFLDSWKRSYETLTEEEAMFLIPNWSPTESTANNPLGLPCCASCCYSNQMQQQMGFAAAAMMGAGTISADGDLPLDFVHQGLKEVVMHEVGHTLGLRHNFRASGWKTMEEINNLELGREEGTIASVMDYAPANISPPGTTQGLYYSQTLGPYDFWAIEYGYKPFKSNEATELATIAGRSHEPGLDYSTDEDTETYDPDPMSNRFDNGADSLTWVQMRVDHVNQLIPNVIDSTTSDGEGYQQARQAFGVLFNEYWRALGFAARFPGGIHVHRDHRGEGARPPFEVVDPATQREAMMLVTNAGFASPDFDGPMFQYLASSRWSHWGTSESSRVEYPVHETVLRVQLQLLQQVLRGRTLERILDNEFTTPADQDAYTLAEHLDAIVDGIFSEWLNDPEAGAEYSNRTPFIDSFRRNLQRETIKQLAALVTSGLGTPEDARTLARIQLSRLQRQATTLLRNPELQLDDYSRAHLLDSQERILQVLNAELALPSVN